MIPTSPLVGNSVDWSTSERPVKNAVLSEGGPLNSGPGNERHIAVGYGGSVVGVEVPPADEVTGRLASRRRLRLRGGKQDLRRMCSAPWQRSRPLLPSSCCPPQVRRRHTRRRGSEDRRKRRACNEAAIKSSEIFSNGVESR